MIREFPASCPFCGSPKTSPDLDGDDGSWVVVCPDCGGHGPARSTRDEAIAAWNHRVIVMPSPETFGELQ